VSVRKTSGQRHRELHRVRGRRPEYQGDRDLTETVAQPGSLIAALDRAADKGKPVVVLKGRPAERVRAAITGHTGGLAGESRVFSEY